MNLRREQMSKIIKFRSVAENDGKLTFWESENEIPFVIKRIFYIQNVPAGCERANHASINSDFVFIAIAGEVSVTLVNKSGEETFWLNNSSEGLFVPRMTWIKTYNFSENAILMVVSDKEYKKTTYISDYAVFIKNVSTSEEV